MNQRIGGPAGRILVTPPASQTEAAPTPARPALIMPLAPVAKEVVAALDPTRALLRELGNDDFDTRERTQQVIATRLAKGDRALYAAVRAAQSDPDLEIARRARELTPPLSGEMVSQRIIGALNETAAPLRALAAVVAAAPRYEGSLDDLDVMDRHLRGVFTDRGYQVLDTNARPRWQVALEKDGARFIASISFGNKGLQASNIRMEAASVRTAHLLDPGSAGAVKPGAHRLSVGALTLEAPGQAQENLVTAVSWDELARRIEASVEHDGAAIREGLRELRGPISFPWQRQQTGW